MTWKFSYKNSEKSTDNPWAKEVYTEQEDIGTGNSLLGKEIINIIINLEFASTLYLNDIKKEIIDDSLKIDVDENDINLSVYERIILKNQSKVEIRLAQVSDSDFD